MTNAEKIAKKKEELAKAVKKVQQGQAKVKKIEEEIAFLETMELKGVIKEFDLSVPEIKELLGKLKKEKKGESNE